jgi:hypothetical protein
MSGQPKEDRDWENWPGRGPVEDGIRHRLKELFDPTEREEAVADLISDRGREIEERTAQLHAAIADLERREELTARLRSAVEELLHSGSTELDARHADLAALARDLSVREEEVSAAEIEVAERRQELGAVELRRAALERRERAAVERDEKLAQAAGAVGAASAPATSHVLFVAADGYRLVERNGAAPDVGAHVEIDGLEYVVARVGRSPLPGDGRACAVLDPLRSQHPA